MRVTSRKPSPYASSHPAEQVVTADGRTLWVKHRALAAGVERPGIDPWVEPRVYRDVLAPLGLGTPELARFDDGELWLESVEGLPLSELEEDQPWEAAARWLARFHVAAAPLAETLELPVWDRDWYARWAQRARAFSDRDPRLDWLLSRWDGVVEPLAALPRTVVHGEYYPSNILVSGSRVCPVDWETAAVGAAEVDLAAFLSGWDEESRARLSQAYGKSDPGMLDLGRLHVCMQWLGWVANWRQEPERERDWLADAVRIAEGLGW